jgi:hypothetical protein
MAGNTEFTVAVGRHICFVVMLAQTGSPTRAVPLSVGIFHTTMTAHTGDEVDAVLRVGGAAEVYHIGVVCISAAVADITAVEIRFFGVGVVETGFPVMILRRRYVGTGLPEAGVTLGAPTRVIDGG